MYIAVYKVFIGVYKVCRGGCEEYNSCILLYIGVYTVYKDICRCI